MDPNATAALLAQAIADGDADAVEEYGQALDEWTARGGFPPAGGDPRD